MPPPDDRASLRDIEHAIGLILTWCDGLDFSEYVEDAKLVSAVERQLAIVGEAVRRLTPAARELRPGVRWPDWIGFRNVLVHAYDRLDDLEVWRVIQEELADFRELAVSMLEEMQPPEARS